MPQDISSPNPLPAPKPRLPTSKQFLIIGLVVLLLVLGGASVYFYSQFFSKNQVPTPQTEDKKPPAEEESAPLKADTVSLVTKTGLTLQVPKSWGGRVYQDDFRALRFELTDWRLQAEGGDFSTHPPKDYFQMEIFTSSKGLVNKYLTFDQPEAKSIAGRSFESSNGQENFASSARKVRQYSWSFQNQQYYLQLFSPNITAYEGQVEALLSSMTYQNTAAVTVTAGEVTSTPKLGNLAFTPVLIESGLIEGQFTDFDPVWKGHKAHGYTFTALAGQRLTTIATERLSGRSYLKSDLYDETGQVIKEDLDTRVEFTTPYTGKYYLVVRNFANTNDKYNLRIQDRDQTDVVIKIKRFADGSEYFFPPEQGTVTVPFTDFAFLVNLNDLSSTTKAEPEVFAFKQTEAQMQATGQTPELGDNLLKTSVYLLDDNRLYVEPVSRAFPAGSHIAIALQIDNGVYYQRIFTK